MILQYQFLDPADSRSLLIFIFVVLAFLILLFGANLIGGRFRRRGRARGDGGFNQRQFARTARRYGLDKIDVSLLEHLIRVRRLKQPYLILTDLSLLDDLLAAAVNAVENNKKMPEGDRERRLSRYYGIRQKIERHAAGGGTKGSGSTSDIRPGQEVTLSPEEGGNYTSRLVSNLREYLALEVPRDSGGVEVRWRRGAFLKAHFFAGGNSGSHFEAKVWAFETVKGTRCLLVKHSKTMAQEQLRRHRRRVVERPCFVYPIRIVEAQQGRKTVRRAALQETKRAMGTIIDVSAGGCSIRSLAPLPTGNLVKVEFELDRKATVPVYGKVRILRKERTAGAVMHIVFTRLSRKHLNSIYRYVYEYSTPARIARARSAV